MPAGWIDTTEAMPEIMKDPLVWLLKILAKRQRYPLQAWLKKLKVG
jgi:hypothetical protein